MFYTLPLWGRFTNDARLCLHRNMRFFNFGLLAVLGSIAMIGAAPVENSPRDGCPDGYVSLYHGTDVALMWLTPFSSTVGVYVDVLGLTLCVDIDLGLNTESMSK